MLRSDPEPDFDDVDILLCRVAVGLLSAQARRLQLDRSVRVRLADLDERLARAIEAPTGVVRPAPTPVSKPVSELTVTEEAERRGCSTSYVRQLIRDKRLPARRTSAGWLVTVPTSEPVHGAHPMLSA